MINLDKIIQENKKRRVRFERHRLEIMDCADEWCGEVPCDTTIDDLSSALDTIDALVARVKHLESLIAYAVSPEGMIASIPEQE